MVDYWYLVVVFLWFYVDGDESGWSLWSVFGNVIWIIIVWFLLFVGVFVGWYVGVGYCGVVVCLWWIGGIFWFVGYLVVRNVKLVGKRS